MYEPNKFIGIGDSHDRHAKTRRRSQQRPTNCRFGVGHPALETRPASQRERKGGAPYRRSYRESIPTISLSRIDRSAPSAIAAARLASVTVAGGSVRPWRHRRKVRIWR